MMLALALTVGPAMAQNHSPRNDNRATEVRSDKQQPKKNTRTKSIEKKTTLKTGTIRLTGKHIQSEKAVAAAKAVNGVSTATYSASTKKLTVKYNAEKTSLTKIKAAVNKAVKANKQGKTGEKTGNKQQPNKQQRPPSKK